MSDSFRGLLIAAALLISGDLQAFEIVSLDWDHVVESRIVQGETVVRCDADVAPESRNAARRFETFNASAFPDCEIQTQSRGSLAAISGNFFRIDTEAAAKSFTEGPPQSLIVKSEADLRVLGLAFDAPRIFNAATFSIRNDRTDSLPITESLSVSNVVVLDTDTDLDISWRDVVLRIEADGSSGNSLPIPSIGSSVITGSAKVFDHETEELLYSVNLASGQQSQQATIPFKERIGHSVRVEFSAKGVFEGVSIPVRRRESAIRFGLVLSVPEPDLNWACSILLWQVSIMLGRRRRKVAFA